ncbi:hypothetical protein [Salinimicrobium gaetbulicola]|uniref:Uncharacterized protein n=1 Tax=Salinimicrobium gaetbulicola TaxID=999702 RepID=A0ABW3IHI7_9FLAO
MTVEEIKLKIKWWESKRWIFNLVVGLFGAYAVYDGLSREEIYWSNADLIGILLWGIGANIFYSAGILVELFNWYYLNNRITFAKFRMMFFIAGLLFSCFWTLWCGWNYFSKPFLW